MSQYLVRPDAGADVRRPEAASTLGPILTALCRAVAPGGVPSHKDWSLVLGDNPAETTGGAHRDKEGIMRAFRRRMGVHALVYLAKHKFGCPKLDKYNLVLASPNGVFSQELDLVVDDPGAIEWGGKMDWDADGRFARLVAGHGKDPDWLRIAAAICVLDYALQAWELSPSRNDLLEEVHLECNVFSRKRMSKVYDDLLSHGLVQGHALVARTR